jgi:ABC-2 type transport system permease protein
MNTNTIIGMIRQGFLDAAYVWREEFRTIFHDAGAMIFLFLLPLGYPLVYAAIYNPETPRNIPIAVVDDCRSSLSREFGRMIDATPQIAVASYAANLGDARRLLDERKVYGIMTLDRNFERDIYRGKTANVMLYCDMNSLLYYRNLLVGSSDVVAAFNTQIQQRGLGGATVQQQSMAISPVKSASVSLFNPAQGFASFIMPAIEVLVIQQSLLLAIGLLAGTQRERNRNKRLIPDDTRFFGTFRVVVGKALCFSTISVGTTCWTMVIVPEMFRFPHLADRGDLYMFLVPFVLASIFLGMTLSCLMRGREMPMLFFVFMSVPLMFISGIAWPWSSIPTAWKWVGSLVPSTYGIQGFVQLNGCGASLHDVKFYYLFEWGLALVYFLTACVVYRYQVQKSEALATTAH